MDYKVQKVETKSDKMRFIKSQWNFYKNNPNFVPPIISDRLKVLDTEKNPFYKHSSLQLFIAVSNGDVIGRVAAIINDNHNKTHNDKIGFFGFFECIDNQEVANSLFAEAGIWLKSKGMQVMRGPENPSMNDEIGLLIDGFDSPPLILDPYNPEYYIRLIENAGFQKAKDLFAYFLEDSFASEKIYRLQSIVRDRYQVSIREVNLKNSKQLMKDIRDIKNIYNAAWMPNWGFVKWTDEEFDFLADDLKQTADSRLAIIAETKGKLAGFAIGLPNINECFIHNKNGSLLGAVWHLLTKKSKIKFLRIIALGVMPEFQKTGIDSILYYELGTRALKMGIKYGEASWILEDNVQMNLGLTKTMNGRVYKKWRLYDKNL